MSAAAESYPLTDWELQVHCDAIDEACRQGLVQVRTKGTHEEWRTAYPSNFEYRIKPPPQPREMWVSKTAIPYVVDNHKAAAYAFASKKSGEDYFEQIKCPNPGLVKFREVIDE